MPSSNFRVNPICLWLLAAMAGVSLLPAQTADPTPPEKKLVKVEGAMVTQANRTLQLAGLPTLPEKAFSYDCYAWSGLSAGIYASFTLGKPEFEKWLASLPGDLEKTMPIPAALYPPPNSSAAWLTPPATDESYVLGRGRIARAAPELLRVYVNPKEYQIQLYYSWNNRRTYP